MLNTFSGGTWESAKLTIMIMGLWPGGVLWAWWYLFPAIKAFMASSCSFLMSFCSLVSFRFSSVNKTPVRSLAHSGVAKRINAGRIHFGFMVRIVTSHPRYEALSYFTILRVLTFVLENSVILVASTKLRQTRQRG